MFLCLAFVVVGFDFCYVMALPYIFSLVYCHPIFNVHTGQNTNFVRRNMIICSKSRALLLCVSQKCL